MKKNAVANILAVRAILRGSKSCTKNVDLSQDFPNKISFHFLWVKMLPKKFQRFSDGLKCAPLAKSWPKILK